MFSLILLYAISASTFVLSKWLLMYSTPLLLTGLRTLVAGVFFCAYVMHRGAYGWRVHVGPCILIGLSSFYLSNTLKFWAMRSVTAQEASSIALIEPLCAIFFAYILCNERVSMGTLMGVLLSIFGLSVGSYGMMGVPACSFATGALICSVIASSYGALLMRARIVMHDADPSTINGLSMLFAGLLASTTACYVEHDVVAQVAQAPVIFWVLFVCMTLLSNIYAYSVYGIMVKRYSAVLISSAGLLRPAYIAFYSGKGDVQLMVSAGIILVGLLIIYRCGTTKQNVLSKEGVSA